MITLRDILLPYVEAPSPVPFYVSLRDARARTAAEYEARALELDSRIAAFAEVPLSAVIALRKSDPATWAYHRDCYLYTLSADHATEADALQEPEILRWRHVLYFGAALGLAWKALLLMGDGNGWHFAGGWALLSVAVLLGLRFVRYTPR